jgi:hypothetical protein
MVAQITVNTHQVPNLARSAIAPEIRATVMIAKTAWKPTNARVGIVPTSLMIPLRPRYSVGSPTSPPPTSLPKATE